MFKNSLNAYLIVYKEYKRILFDEYINKLNFIELKIFHHF